MKIILASKSPRRKELLAKLFADFEIVVSDIDESIENELCPHRAVELLAVRKGAAVAEKHPDALVISSDTLVELDGKPLGKPRDRQEAYLMLRSLSGKTHRVDTGIAVHYKDRCCSDVAVSEVCFRELSDFEIYEYIDSGEPFDKAGGYGIQGAAGKFVSSYTGDFDTIVGLSVNLTRELCKTAVKEHKNDKEG